MRLQIFAAFIIALSSLGSAQTAKTSVSPQTPRQAIIEVITSRDSGALERHLPEATKKYWASHLNQFPMMFAQGALVAMAGAGANGVMVKNPEPNPNFQTFSAGPVLVRDRDPQSGTITELRIDNEDYNNDEDSIDLSFHTSGQDIALPFEMPNVRVNMKREAGIWRFEEVDFTTKLALGDLAFVKQTLSEQAGQAQLMAIDAVQSVAASESEYLQRAGGKNYSCSLSQLAPKEDKSDTAQSLNASVNLIEAKGYKIQLSDCTASSFHASAVPQQSGQPFFCADQSGAIRKSNKGIADCFAAGEPVHDDNAVQLSPQ